MCNAILGLIANQWQLVGLIMIISAMQAFAVGLEAALSFEHVLYCAGIESSLDPAHSSSLSHQRLQE